MIQLLGQESTIKSACFEKVESYKLLLQLGVPVLKSAIILQSDTEIISDLELGAIKEHIGNERGMLRYLYKIPNKNVQNGGKIIALTKENLFKEQDKTADLWILEPMDRLKNLCACNTFVNREMGYAVFEIVGMGFDVSDLNKGAMSPHEKIEMPYPFWRGYYNEWWKRSRFLFCTQSEYEESVVIRKKRLDEPGDLLDNCFNKSFYPPDLSLLNKLLDYIYLIDAGLSKRNVSVYNVSCSISNNGRIVFWDIQTPGGKRAAYMNAASSSAAEGEKNECIQVFP